MENKDRHPTSEPAPLTEETVHKTTPDGEKLIIGLGGIGSSAMEHLKFVLGKKNAEPSVFIPFISIDTDDTAP